MIDATGWTFGCEHEWADWPLARPLPENYGRDMRDHTIVNSNGIANDPKGRLYGFGGEINTPPTDTPEGQVDCLEELKTLLPEATINYRSNLHIHIRVPGLREELDVLKDLQRWIHATMPKVFRVVEPLPRPEEQYMHDPAVYKGELRRWRRRRVSHQTLLTGKRLKRQLAAPDLTSFFEWEVPESKGRPMWHFQPRLCVNIRQLLETDTIEFRHFPGTLNSDEMFTAVNWCREYLLAGLLGRSDLKTLLSKYEGMDFPPFPDYDHVMECRYRATCHDGSVKKEDIAANIKAILEGTWK